MSQELSCIASSTKYEKYILPEYNTKNVPTFTWPWVKHEKRYPVLDIIHAKILRKEKPARLADLLIMYSHQ